jgi:hypothetical protein
LASDALSRALARLPGAPRVVTRDLLAADGRLDAVACDRDGTVVGVLRAPPGGDRAALVDLLAHLLWLEARLPDWRALAPDLPLASDAPVRGLLLATGFDRRTLAAAAALGPEQIALGHWHAPPPDVEGEPWIELLAPEAGPAPAEPGAPRPGPDSRGAEPPGSASRFRTGLTDEDLASAPGG